jgi:hypothetical protein
MSDLVFKPVIAIMSSKLVKVLSESFENIDQFINEDMLHKLFVESAKEHSNGAKPSSSKASASKASSSDEKEEKKVKVAAKSKDETVEKKEKKNTKPPCCYEGCDKHVLKVDRLIEGKVYCSRHYALKVKQAERAAAPPKEAKAAKESKDSKKETKSSVEVHPIEEVKEQPKAVSKALPNDGPFDFATEVARDFEDSEDTFWTLSPYGKPQEKLMIHARTKLIFTSDKVKMMDSPFVGLLVNDQVVPAAALDMAVISWVQNSNITVSQSILKQSSSTYAKVETSSEASEAEDEHVEHISDEESLSF